MRVLLAILVLLCLMGCAQSAPLRSRMEQTASPPEGVQQTQFAHIGEVKTSEGIFHVATQRLVLKGMLAPRGLPHRLLLFDDRARLMAAYEYGFDSAPPLWCEGSRAYLFGFGSFHGVEVDRRIARSPDDGQPTGNVLDFSRGPLAPLLTREQRYSSSGGIADDPWHPGH